MKTFLVKVYILLFFFFLLPELNMVSADYVLPYPSLMPGNKLYKLSRYIDKLSVWWYWGNIAKVKYYLKISDKYLVEAKILFEYKQFLLATDALDRSDNAFSQMARFMVKVKEEKKDVALLQTFIINASGEHQRILNVLSEEIPDRFLWTPEKTVPTELDLKNQIEEAINIRAKVANYIMEL